VAGVLIVVGFAASLTPALRTLRIDPMAALATSDVAHAPA
jgi:hypothetical protein